MTKLYLFVLALVCSFLSGCLAYRVSAFSETPSGVEPESGTKYKIRNLLIEFDSSKTDPGFVIPSIAKMPRERVVSAITAKSPSYFTSSSQGVPVDVALRMRSARTENVWSLLVYVCSGGFLPMWMDYITENDVTVKVFGMGETVKSASLPLRMMYSFSMSFYTPIGGIPYEAIPTAISNTTKAPAFPGPSDDEMLDAFADSTAKVIIRAIAKCGGTEGLKRPARAVVPVSPSSAVKARQKTPAARGKKDEIQFDGQTRAGACSICGAIKGKDDECPLCQGIRSGEPRRTH